MKINLHEKLYHLADSFEKPLYVVGGYVRNSLLGCEDSTDIDISAAIPVSKVCEAAKKLGFTVDSYFRRLGTARFISNDLCLEYSSFRREFYPENGSHLPVNTEQTEDINEDARRRDFTCNAVYYDIKTGEFVDPLGGLEDIKNKALRVADSGKTFLSDGLRLMRLARFTGELDFTPTEQTIIEARENAKNILDISAERVYEEFNKILYADTKSPVSSPEGHYKALKVLSEIGVLDYILPELTMGRGMEQRADFHKYDVLEHSLRTVLYAKPRVRLAALLHDVGKPICMKRFKEYTGHAGRGEKIAVEILKRIKVDAKTLKHTAFLVGAHMIDLNCDKTEKEVRKFIADYAAYIPDLLLLKQADFSAGKDDLSISPVVKKWQAVYEKMLTDGTPFSVKDLKITAEELMEIGYNGAHIGAEQVRLREAAIYNPSLNENGALRALAKEYFNKN